MRMIEINAMTGEVTERDLTDEELVQIEDVKAIIPEIPYDKKVVDLIRERYSVDDEFAIQRQKDTKPIEFENYFNYCEECKLKAKE